MLETEQEVQEDGAEIRKIRGLDLILKSINCENYKPVFDKHGINEHSLVNLTASDLRLMNVDNKDITSIMTAVNVLKKTVPCPEVRLSNDEILKVQSNICGQLGSIAVALNHIYYSISSDENDFDDVLIDNYLSSVDAALMLKPHMRAENKNVEKSLKRVYKLKKSGRTMLITTTTILLFGVTFWHLNRSLNFNSTFSNLISKMKSW